MYILSAVISDVTTFTMFELSNRSLSGDC